MKTLYATTLCVFGLVMSACEQPYQITTSGSPHTANQQAATPLTQASVTPEATASPTPTETPPQPTFTPEPVVTVSPTPDPIVLPIPDPTITMDPIPLPTVEIPVPPPVPTVTVTPTPTIVPTATPTVSPSPCIKISQVTQDIRVMLMVDNSEFTQITDPNHRERAAAIDNFISTYGYKTNLTYSYGCFATKGYIYNMKPGGSFLSNTGYPFGDVREARAALEMFKTIRPHGVSNYKAVFNRLQDAIVNDLASGGNQNYVVVFMSAGRPNDLGRTAQSQIAGITALVNEALQAAGPGRLTISSVFIGDPRDTQAVNNLQTMAQLGGGQFVGANSKHTVLLNDIINVPGQCSPEN